LYITPAWAVRTELGQRVVDYDPTGRTVGKVPQHTVTVVEPMSQFEAYLVSEQPVGASLEESHSRLWVGPVVHFEWWRTLAHPAVFDVDEEKLPVTRTTGAYRAACPLNIRDVPQGVIQSARYVEIARARLACDATCVGEYYEISPGVGFPVGMRFRVDPGMLPPDLTTDDDLLA
jgi:hypothetical protein